MSSGEIDRAAEARALLEGGRGAKKPLKNPEESEIEGATFEALQDWLTEVLQVTRAQLASAFERYEDPSGNKINWHRASWDGKKVDDNTAEVERRKSVGTRRRAFEVRVGTSDGIRTPSVNALQEDMSGKTYVGKDGRIHPRIYGKEGRESR